MLLKITNFCRMECKHCCEESNRHGKHMTGKVFQDTIKFINRLEYQPKSLLISGGEPTDHPLFFQMMMQLKEKYKGHMMITSNGMFLEDKELTKQILELDIYVQITNDVRYYPKRIKRVEHKNFIYVDKLMMLAPFGRALSNNLKCDRISPYCFNARSVHSQVENFSSMLGIMELQLHKFCEPMIDVSGSIALGEMGLCYKIGNIYDDEKTLSENIKNMKCNKCKLYDNMSVIHKNVVGETYE